MANRGCMEAMLLFLILMVFALVGSSAGGKIGVYWGQAPYRRREADLTSTCTTGNYSFVNIAFLNVFGNGQTPQINLTSHCNTSSANGGCTGLSKDIKFCQNKGIKVMLSIGGVGGSYSLSSTEDAKNVADYLWNNFLGGNSSSRPLGDAVLDGIDFYIDIESIKYWDNLAMYLYNYTSNFESSSSIRRKFYLSGSPKCSDLERQRALYTGLFNYLSIRFYNNNNTSCEYDEYSYRPSSVNLRNSWFNWTQSVSTKKLFLGIPAASNAAESGYIPVRPLSNDILPVLKTVPKYAGVVLWNKYYDINNRYSSLISRSV